MPNPPRSILDPKFRSEAAPKQSASALRKVVLPASMAAAAGACGFVLALTFFGDAPERGAAEEVASVEVADDGNDDAAAPQPVAVKADGSVAAPMAPVPVKTVSFTEPQSNVAPVKAAIQPSGAPVDARFARDAGNTPPASLSQLAARMKIDGNKNDALASNAGGAAAIQTAFASSDERPDLDNDATASIPPRDPDRATNIITDDDEPQADNDDAAPSRSSRMNTAATMRAAPDNDGKPLGTLAGGSQVGIISCKGGWCNVSQGGRSGYVAARFVSGAPSRVASNAPATPRKRQAVANAPEPANTNLPGVKSDVVKVAPLPTPAKGNLGYVDTGVRP